MLKTRFWIDALIFTWFLFALEPNITGDSLHEWLSIIAVAVLIIHFLFHWDWFLRTTTKFFQNLLHVSRLNYIVILIVFIGFVTIITSGLMISETVSPIIGLYVASGRGWRKIHELSADLTLIAVGVHFALHWDWVKNTFTKLIIQPVFKSKTKIEET